jgi:uncharacterized protein (TIGR02001 family)
VTAPAPVRPRHRRPAEPIRALRALAFLIPLSSPLTWSGPALAQVAATVAIDSDYRVRGVSFSDDKPAASLSLSYDHGDGLYAGVTGVAGQTDAEGIKPLGYQANLGYARRMAAGWSVDVGVSTARYAQYLYPRRSLGYCELYAGVATGPVSTHLYWSPDYLGQHVQTLYGEIEGVVAVSPNLKLFGHAGLLAPLNGQGSQATRPPRYDVRAGLALDVSQAELRLAWSHAQAAPGDLPGYFHGGNAVTASAAWSF